MDVLQRLMPRTGAGNGVQFKRLKHHSQCSATPLSEESPVWLNPNNGDHPNSTTDQDQLALIPATNSPRVELGLVLNNNNGQGNREEHNGKKEGGGKPRGKSGKVSDNKDSIVRSGENNTETERAKIGGKRLIAAFFPAKQKGQLSTSTSEPKLNSGHEDASSYANSSLDIDFGNQKQEQHHKDGEKNRLYCEDDTHDRRSNRRFHVSGALQRVRSKFQGRQTFGLKNNDSVQNTNSTSIHRSNTAPMAFSATVTENGEEHLEKIQRQNGPVLTKLRKQAKIMDIMVRKSHGNSGANRKSDAQCLLLSSEEDYGSGMD